jgi:hypothetical protein
MVGQVAQALKLSLREATSPFDRLLEVMAQLADRVFASIKCNSWTGAKRRNPISIASTLSCSKGC